MILIFSLAILSLVSSIIAMYKGTKTRLGKIIEKYGGKEIILVLGVILSILTLTKEVDTHYSDQETEKNTLLRDSIISEGFKLNISTRDSIDFLIEENRKLARNLIKINTELSLIVSGSQMNLNDFNKLNESLEMQLKNERTNFIAKKPKINFKNSGAVILNKETSPEISFKVVNSGYRLAEKINIRCLLLFISNNEIYGDVEIGDDEYTIELLPPYSSAADYFIFHGKIGMIGKEKGGILLLSIITYEDTLFNDKIVKTLHFHINNELNKLESLSNFYQPIVKRYLENHHLNMAYLSNE